MQVDLFITHVKMRHHYNNIVNIFRKLQYYNLFIMKVTHFSYLDNLFGAFLLNIIQI